MKRHQELKSPFIHITLGMNPFHQSPDFPHPLIQTWPLCGAHTIFGPSALGVKPPDGNLSVTEGQGRASSARSRFCLLRISPRGARDGGGRGPARPCWRWQGGEKFHRSADGQENLSANRWHQQQPRLNHSYRGAECLWGRAQKVWVSETPSQQESEPTGETAGAHDGGQLGADTSFSFLLQKSTFKLWPWVEETGIQDRLDFFILFSSFFISSNRPVTLMLMNVFANIFHVSDWFKSPV